VKRIGKHFGSLKESTPAEKVAEGFNLAVAVVLRVEKVS